MNKEEIILFLVAQKESFLRSFGVTKLGLFGSAARGEKPNDIDLIVEFVFEVPDVLGALVLDPNKADRLFYGLPVGPERAIVGLNVLSSKEFRNRFVDQWVKDFGACLMAAHHVGRFGF